jgi:hypothetical protein
MMGYLLTQGATILCQHGGQAQPTVTNSRVKVNGQPTVPQSSTYTISACPYVQAAYPSPCIAAQWTSGATRVKSGGVPVLLKESQATCVPNGTGVNILVTQMRVKGS